MPAERPTYETLRATAIECVQSASPILAPDGEIAIDKSRISAVRAPSCTHSWGPHYFALSRFPKTRSTNDFITHMERMIPNLETWAISIQDVVVDQERRVATLRTYLFMTPKGLGSKKERTIMNEELWYVTMTEDGKKVQSAEEYVDSEASAAVLKKMRAGKEAGVIWYSDQSGLEGECGE